MIIFLLLWMAGTDFGNAPTPAFNLWQTDAGALEYWDLHADGRIDVIDLLYFRDLWFEDVTDTAGIVTSHVAVGDYFGIGQCWGDYDNDGFLDLYVTDAQGPNTLFRNNGDGTFSVSPLSGLISLPAIGSSGALWVDYDNDGWQDLYVLNNGPNSLFRNIGGGVFTDVSAAAGVADDNKSMSGAWGDLNGDGFLDLYVANWGEPAEKEDGLYLNNGDGTFNDIGNILGAQRLGPGCTLSFLDFDNDMDSDIYVVNDKLYGNVLWRNDGPNCPDWCLTDVSAQANANTQVWGMGLAVGDYDGDLDLDLYFSHIGPMVLLQNQIEQGQAVFQSKGAFAGVDLDVVGWGAVFFDYNNDSLPDLYLATSQPDMHLCNRLYTNRGDGTFADHTLKSGAANRDFTQGVAYADYDRDGFLDLAIGNRGSGYRLYRNLGKAGKDNEWVSIQLTGAQDINRNAVGSRVYLYLDNGQILLQEVKCGSSLGAGNDLALHFGLGTASIQQMMVQWPNGDMNTFKTVPDNCFLSLTYPDDMVVLNP